MVVEDDLVLIFFGRIRGGIMILEEKKNQ